MLAIGRNDMSRRSRAVILDGWFAGWMGYIDSGRADGRTDGRQNIPNVSRRAAWCFYLLVLQMASLEGGVQVQIRRRIRSKPGWPKETNERLEPTVLRMRCERDEEGEDGEGREKKGATATALLARCAGAGRF